MFLLAVGGKTELGTPRGEREGPREPFCVFDAPLLTKDRVQIDGDSSRLDVGERWWCYRGIRFPVIKPACEAEEKKGTAELKNWWRKMTDSPHRGWHCQKE